MGPRRNKPRLPGALIWIAVAVLVIGGTFWLAGRDTTKPQVKIEKVIPDNALAH
jgi:hypothetical protein